MKKYILMVMSIISLFSLIACNEDISVSEPHTEIIEADGQSLLISFDENNQAAGTITTENGEYTFEYDAPGRLTIVYPDGYIYKQIEENGAVSSSADYSRAEVISKGYFDAYSLIWCIESSMENKEETNRGNSPSLPTAIFLLGLGVWNLMAPKSAWWLARGWWYKNAEPSELALVLYRMAGAILVLVGIVCFFASF